MGKLWEGIKKKVKDQIEENKKLTREIQAMSDKELKKKAVTHGGRYADAWVERKRAEAELNRRIKER